MDRGGIVGPGRDQRPGGKENLKGTRRPLSSPGGEEERGRPEERRGRKPARSGMGAVAAGLTAVGRSIPSPVPLNARGGERPSFPALDFRPRVSPCLSGRPGPRRGSKRSGGKAHQDVVACRLLAWRTPSPRHPPCPAPVRRRGQAAAPCAELLRRECPDRATAVPRFFAGAGGARGTLGHGHVRAPRVDAERPRVANSHRSRSRRGPPIVIAVADGSAGVSEGQGATKWLAFGRDGCGALPVSRCSASGSLASPRTHPEGPTASCQPRPTPSTENPPRTHTVHASNRVRDSRRPPAAVQRTRGPRCPRSAPRVNHDPPDSTPIRTHRETESRHGSTWKGRARSSHGSGRRHGGGGRLRDVPAIAGPVLSGRTQSPGARALAVRVETRSTVSGLSRILGLCDDRSRAG